MQSFYAADFEREMGCTAEQWLAWLPQAVGEHPWTRHANSAEVLIGAGKLGLTWQMGAPREIGCVSIPVLKVAFRFDGLEAAQRHIFMQRFDLYFQRGGG